MSVRPIAITVSQPAGCAFERYREPVSCGIAYARGVATAEMPWGLFDRDGVRIPVQTSVLDRWSDGTVRWMLVEFQGNVALDGARIYTLEPADRAEPPTDLLTADQDGKALIVETGVATFNLPLGAPGFMQSAHVDGRPILRSTSITAEDAAGTRSEFKVSRGRVADRGPLRLTVELDGTFIGPAGQQWLVGALRLSFYAGLGSISAEFSVTNPRSARHPGGTWDLGDPGSALIRELSIEVVRSATTPGSIRGSLETGERMVPASKRFSVYQDSSGGVNWQHYNHVNREGRVPTTFCGFRAERDTERIEGLRATPVIAIGEGAEQVTTVLPRFWQMCPKAISADEHRLVLGMFPRDYGDLHELQGGERTTLRFGLCFGGDAVSEAPLAWMRSPLNVTADPSAYQDAGAWAKVLAGSPSAMADYETLIDAAVSADDTFAHRREVIDEYGWRNFGDLYADHEAVKQPLVSHYNNQYDALAGFLTRYLQAADVRWWNLADDLALHVADIDTYHSSRDRAAYSGGHFWHTQHYQPAGTATHRAYSRRSDSSGGGPSAEHNYTSGLMLHYFLTGAERSRAAVIQLADWVLAMEDGSTTIFRWIDSGDTGFASSTRSPDFHGPGRGAGNSINALLDAHRLTSDARYLEKAEALVARCVHPDDNPDAVELLDIENRWSYTVFLQVLGKYLEYRADRGWYDAKFEYARLVLVNYAKWMCAKEQPYLDRVGQLEFPTETWAAQDIRKAAVFEWAAAYSTNASDRTTFLDRAASFFGYATGYLVQAPTGRLTRPIVLLLAYGFQRPTRSMSVAAVAAIVRTPLPRVTFVPQRRRALRRVVMAAAALSVASLIAMAWFVR